ncbi:hypothetical protein [Williamsia sp. 1135]|uniref:hypothetical protein n=1 Tax=Williamsia sp. 1135 TaxID=1889262 RepID=UPI00117C8367|nr:hypothetical protein [Williamsia sp. 1135]
MVADTSTTSPAPTGDNAGTASPRTRNDEGALLPLRGDSATPMASESDDPSSGTTPSGPPSAFTPAAIFGGSVLPDIFYRLTNGSGGEGLILLNQGVMAAAVLNRRSRGDGQDLLALIRPGESFFVPKSVIAELSLGKHAWDYEAADAALDDPTISRFLTRALAPTEQQSGGTSPAVQSQVSTLALAIESAEIVDEWEWLSQFPGYIDLPLPGEPGYSDDPRGDSTNTDNVIRSDQNYFALWLNESTWTSASEGDPLDRYFTLDDVPLAQWSGNDFLNIDWMYAVTDVAFLGYRSGDLERELGYADGFYDPDYNDPGGKIYYTNSAMTPVLVTIYSNVGGVQTSEHITLNPGTTVEIAKPSALAYDVITVQSPRGDDGRINVITTQVLGFPELTQDIRNIDLPGAMPTGNANYDNAIYAYATGHVDNYYFYPDSAPASWTFTAVPPPEEPPIDPTDPTISYKITEIEQILSIVLSSQAYSFLSNTATLVGTLLGNDVFLDGSIASSITKIGGHMAIGEYRQAAFEFGSLVVDAAGEIARGPAKATAVLTLSVAAAQVVLYAGEQASEIDWSSTDETGEYLRELGFAGAAGVIFEETGRAFLTVGNELGLKLADGFLRART